MLRRLRHALPRGPHGGGAAARLDLVLVLVFVVFAVIQLTRTVVSAMDIADSAAVIDAGLEPVERNTAQITLLDRTSQLTGGIVGATGAVEEQAAQVDQSAERIRVGARSIERAVVAIDGGVDDVTALAGDINVTSNQLSDAVVSIERTVTAIEAEAGGINERFAALLPVSRMIARGPAPFGVNNINRNESIVIGLLQDLEPDLDNVLISVDEVDEHAVSICRSDVVRGRNCGEP
jgi:hypothetical protein